MPGSLFLLLFLVAGAVALVAGGAALWPAAAERWLGLVAPRGSGRQGILFYAASHGELLLLERLLPLLRRMQPEADLMVLAATPSVLQLAERRLAGTPAYCVTPLLPSVRGRLLQRLSPDLFVVVEFARIPLWTRAAQRLGVPLAIINGRISRKNQRACRRWPWLLRPMLAAFEQVLVQTAADAEDFRRHGAQHAAVEVAGAMKFEAAETNRDTAATRQLAQLAGVAAGDVVLLGGSTQGDEEAVLASVFQRLAPQYPQLRLILVPRNRRRFEQVAQMLEHRGLPFQRRSQLPPTAGEAPARVLLVDTVGELAAWWGVAHLGFVGASLIDRGGHNMIEPAALGVATCFGPHTDNFRDVVALLLANSAAAEVAGEAELLAFVQQCLAEPTYAAELATRAKAVCRTQIGAMRRTGERLSAILDDLRGPVLLPFPVPQTRPRLALRKAA